MNKLKALLVAGLFASCCTPSLAELWVEQLSATVGPPWYSEGNLIVNDIARDETDQQEDHDGHEQERGNHQYYSPDYVVTHGFSP